MIEVRNNEGDSRQLGIVTRKIFESQVGRSIDCRPVRDVCEADPRDMFAAIDAAVSVTIRRVEVNLRANGRQALCISLERTAFFNQLLAEAACLERIIGMVVDARHLIAKTDVLITAREQPEIVALTGVLLAEHVANASTLCR